jgi:vacuolar-type H+-ATPase subunit E/Vma4
MSVEGIIDRILADAQEEARSIIHGAENEAGALEKEGMREADEYFERRKAQLDEHYRREKERAILNKRLDQRKNMLQARQKWMDRAFSDAFKMLVDQPLDEYKELVISLIAKVSRSNDEEVVFGKKGDAKFLEKLITELNKKTKGKFSISKKRGDFPWGFILKKEKVEINMSISSLFKYKRSELERKVWEIFNAG